MLRTNMGVFEDVNDAIDAAWDDKKMDFLGLETTLVAILSSKDDDTTKVTKSKCAIDAFTKRGHFIPIY